MKICIWFDFNLLGLKISLLWICKDTACNSWLVSGNWQMNNGWRLYLYLSITDRNLHIFSPPHSSAPLDFLPTPHFTVVNNLHELTGASGVSFLSSLGFFASPCAVVYSLPRKHSALLASAPLHSPAFGPPLWHFPVCAAGSSVDF